MEVMSIKSWPAFTLLPQSKVAGLDFQSTCLSLDLIGQRVRRPSCHVVTGVKPLDGFHVIITQREVKEIDVLLHTLKVGGLRDDDDPVLNEEPKGYLCGSLSCRSIPYLSFCDSNNLNLPQERNHFVSHFLLVVLITFQSFFQHFLFIGDALGYHGYVSQHD